MRIVPGLISLLMTIAACQGKDAPQLTLGSSACHTCQSLIRHLQWAARDRGSSGEIRLYDDPGCLLSNLKSESSKGTAVVFQDHDGGGAWIKAADVWLAKTGEASPQGYGWAAYKSFAAAQDAVTAAGKGEIQRWSEVLANFSQR